MGFFENIGTSLTGSIDKALLCVKKMKPSAPTGGALTSQGGRTSISNVDLQAKLAAEAGKKLISSRASVEAIGNKNGYHVLQVKYNPSRIQFSSRAGSFMQPGPGGVGTNTLTQITMPAQTFMNVELLFDDENHQDAFMWEKFTNLSAGALVSDVSGIVKNVRSKGYSVQPQIDALIGMITQSETRQVVFYWSDMVFAGEVSAIDAKYTMFNPMGDPIRGTVLLTFRQGGQDTDGTGEDPYWNKAFDTLFVKDKINGGGWGEMAGNLLNLK